MLNLKLKLKYYEKYSIFSLEQKKTNINIKEKKILNENKQGDSIRGLIIVKMMQLERNEFEEEARLGYKYIYI